MHVKCFSLEAVSIINNIMEEVQSWWEVPAVAHFCYVFRSAFNLFFFEIAELESALLNIQDPDMSISVDQLVVRLLQGCCDEESVNYDNWEEKLHELFNDNFEDEENPLGESYFPHLSPRSKIEVLLKLCELRLDVEGALDDIKNIPAEDMQAKCIGKDSQNNTYWYFCNERLYREASSSEKVMTQPVKSVKKDSNKIRQSTREKKSKVNPNNHKSWTIACFTISDWKHMSNSLSRSKKSHDKELSAAMKKYLPLLEERVAEKDRFLRKRFLELIPKRASSRISKVQAKKKLEEVKAAEEAKEAELKAEKERARKEALLLKQMKESRQKRAEERSKAVEERAERAKLRELIRVEDTDSSQEEENDRSSANKVSSVKSQKKKDRRNQFNKRKVKEKSDNEFDDECHKNNYLRIRKKDETPKSNASATQPNHKRCIRTYSAISRQSENGVESGDKPVKVNYQKHVLNSCESRSAILINSVQSPKLHCASQNSKKVCSDDEYNNKNSCTSDSSNSIKVDTKSSKCTKIEDSSSKPNSSNLSDSRFPQAINSPIPPRITIYKQNVLSNSPDMTKWNTAFDSRQKVRILYKSSDNLAPKRIKLEQVNFRTVPTNMQSALTKENHLYKPVQFITYGKIIPSSALVKLDYKKPPNQQLSS